MSGKNKMPLNIIIDFVMLMAMALVSISGFILEIVIPSRHAVRFQDATPWCSHLLGLGRHDWGNIHLWAGVVLVTLLAIHILLHIKMVSAFVTKKCPNHTLRILLYVLLLMLCKRLLNYILCIRFFSGMHSIVSASQFPYTNLSQGCH